MKILVLVGLFPVFLILLGAIYKKPMIGLVLFTISLFIPPYEFLPILKGIPLVRILAIITFMCAFAQRTKERYSRAVQTKLLFTLCLIMCCSFFTSIWHSVTVTNILNFVKVIIAYFTVLLLIDSKDKIKVIIWTMILSGLFIGITSIMGFAGDGRMRGSYTWMFANANDLALCFVMLLPFAVYLMLIERGVFKKIFLIAAQVVYVLGLFLTASRGGLLAFGVMTLAILVKTKKKFLVLLCFLILLPVLFHFMPENMKMRMTTMGGDMVTQDVNVVSRLDAWKAGLSMMTHRLFGVGVGNFEEGYVIYQPPFTVINENFRLTAHNAFIQIGGETGFLGLFTFFLLIFNSLKSLTRSQKFLQGIDCADKRVLSGLIDATFVSLISFSTAMFFLSQAYNWLLYFLIAFSVVFERLVGKEASFVQGQKNNEKEVSEQSPYKKDYGRRRP